jgi:Family of unknown function (DUF6600)
MAATPAGRMERVVVLEKRFTIAVLAVALLAAPGPGRAADAVSDNAAIPSSAVARLKIDQGTAWVRGSDSGDWVEAAGNYPLVERSRVSVPDGSEAEIQFRGSQSLLLQGGSEIDILQLAQTEVSYRLRSGEAELSLPAEDFAPVHIAVPGNGAVRVDAPGRYSLSTDGNVSRFVVNVGAGAAVDPAGALFTVNEGEEATIGEQVQVSRVETDASEGVPQVPVLTEPERDAGVPPEVAGDLRPYGEWVYTPEYGYVWRPYVADGWEPYYYGQWAWVAPYGWTWDGYEPWGWWPYHTGWWWPSPVFGWVWCPFHSFVSFNFAFGHSVYHGHHARFFPANVRFVGRNGFVRWVPERPGVVASRSRAMPRDSAAMARWNRPVDRGSVMVRRAGGSPVAWEGRGGRIASTAGPRGSAREAMTRGGQRSAAAGLRGDIAGGVRRSGIRNHDIGRAPARAGNTVRRAPAFPRESVNRSFRSPVSVPSRNGRSAFHGARSNLGERSFGGYRGFEGGSHGGFEGGFRGSRGFEGGSQGGFRGGFRGSRGVR